MNAIRDVLAGQSPFGRQILLALLEVPAGRVISYGQLAARAGRPGAARAAGRVLHANPLPGPIPCHRVVRADGRLGGYAGGAKRKARLLAREGVVLDRRDRIEAAFFC